MSGILTFDGANGTAGIGGDVVWEYWDGAAWTALADVSDDTDGFTTAPVDAQFVTWTVPNDWTITSLNGSADLFYVRARITTAYSTNPVYDEGFSGEQLCGAPCGSQCPSGFFCNTGCCAPEPG